MLQRHHTLYTGGQLYQNNTQFTGVQFYTETQLHVNEQLMWAVLQSTIDWIHVYIENRGMNLRTLGVLY